MNETNKILLLAVAILANVACAKTNQTFILDPSITYPEERNVAVAVPVIAVEIEVLN